MSTVRANTILDSSGGNTATLNGIPLRQGVLDPENRIINGSFDFWQRGTSQTASGYGSADRYVNAQSGGTVTMSQQSFTVGDTLGSNSPTFFLRQTVSGQSLTTHQAHVEHRIEGVRSYAGQTITLLGWARRSSGTGNMAVSLDQSFGTGGSPSTAVSGSGQTVTLTGSWAAFAVTFSVPSITGKTLGTNGNDSLQVNLWTSAGSTFDARTNSLGLQTIGVDLWGIHIKLGTQTVDAVSLYKQPELGPELARCQRFYEIRSATNSNQISFSGNVTSGSAYFATIRFAVIKRGVPSVTTTAWDASGFPGTASTVGEVATSGFRVNRGANATISGAYFSDNWTADAEL